MESPAFTPYRAAASPHIVAARPRLPLTGREVLAVVFSVLLADLLLLEGDHLAAGGPFLAALFALAPAPILLGRRVRGSLPAAVGWLAALLGIVVVRTCVDPTPLTTLTGSVTLFAIAVAARRPRTLGPRLLASAARIVPALPSRLGALRRGVRAMAGDRLRGGLVSVGVAVGLSAVFALVFALANPVVEGAVLRALEGIGLAPLFFRLAVWPVALFAALALVRPPVALRPATEPALGIPGRTWTSTAELSLVSLNLMFLAYLGLDAAVLATGHAPDGVTTQDYAHRGAFWLTVAMLMLTAVVTLLFHGPLAHAPEGKRSRRLATVWIGQGALLAIATYGRIGIHVHHSGLSNLRIVGVLGTTLVLAGMILVARKLHRARSTGWMLGRQLEVFLVVVALYAVAPTHWISARWNVHRVEDGAIAPLLHVAAQSRAVEAVTEFLPLLDHPDPRVRVGVAAYLADARDALRADLAEERHGWRSVRPLATWRSIALERAGMRIDDALDAASCEALGLDAATAYGSPRRCAQNALDALAYSTSPY